MMSIAFLPGLASTVTSRGSFAPGGGEEGTRVWRVGFAVASFHYSFLSSVSLMGPFELVSSADALKTRTQTDLTRDPCSHGGSGRRSCARSPRPHDAHLAHLRARHRASSPPSSPRHPPSNSYQPRATVPRRGLRSPQRRLAVAVVRRGGARAPLVHARVFFEPSARTPTSRGRCRPSGRGRRRAGFPRRSRPRTSAGGHSLFGGTTRARVRGTRGARRGRDDETARGGAAGATRRADAGAGRDMSPVPAARDVGSATTFADSVVGFLVVSSCGCGHPSRNDATDR